MKSMKRIYLYIIVTILFAAFKLNASLSINNINAEEKTKFRVEIKNSIGEPQTKVFLKITGRSEVFKTDSCGIINFEYEIPKNYKRTANIYLNEDTKNPEKTFDVIRKGSPYEIYLKEKLEYDSLVIQYKHHVQMLDEIFEIMADTLSSNRKTIRIGGDDKPAEIVKSRLMKLEHEHMQFAMDCILENTTKIKNIRQYILTTIYNATQTIDSYYTTLVNHDLYGD